MEDEWELRSATQTKRLPESVDLALDRITPGFVTKADESRVGKFLEADGMGQYLGLGERGRRRDWKGDKGGVDGR